MCVSKGTYFFINLWEDVFLGVVSCDSEVWQVWKWIIESQLAGSWWNFSDIIWGQHFLYLQEIHPGCKGLQLMRPGSSPFLKTICLCQEFICVDYMCEISSLQSSGSALSYLNAISQSAHTEHWAAEPLRLSLWTWSGVSSRRGGRDAHFQRLSSSFISPVSLPSSCRGRKGAGRSIWAH